MRVNPQKMKRTIKVLFITLIIMMLAVGAFGFAYFKMNDNKGDQTFTDDGGNTHQINEGVISFMVFGLDSDDARESANKGYRTDVMMLCVVDTDKNTASLVSLPRDTEAKVQVLNSEGKVRKTVTTKLNAAFSYGFSPNKYGYENAMAAINDVFDTGILKIDEIENYVGFDMDGFVGIVDALGGVEIELPQDVPGFGKEGQVITLNSKQALEYVRIRKGQGLTGSDLDRTTRQRGFVLACIKKLRESNPITVLPKIYEECIKKGYLKTNMSLRQITAVASAVSNLELEEASMEMLPGYLYGGYWVPDDNKVAEMLLRLYYNTEDGSAPVLITRNTTRRTTTAKPKTTTSKTTVKTTTSNTTKSTTGNTTKQTTVDTTKQTTVNTTQKTTVQTTQKTTQKTNQSTDPVSIEE